MGEVVRSVLVSVFVLGCGSVGGAVCGLVEPLTAVIVEDDARVLGNWLEEILCETITKNRVQTR